MSLLKKTQWTEQASEELFSYIKENDRQALRKIDQLIQQVHRDPENFIKLSESLHGDLKGFYSRRITKKHRFVFRYRITETEAILEIIQCKSHYNDK